MPAQPALFWAADSFTTALIKRPQGREEKMKPARVYVLGRMIISLYFCTDVNIKTVWRVYLPQSQVFFIIGTAGCLSYRVQTGLVD